MSPLLPTSAAETLGLTLLHSLWQITAVAALFAVGHRTLPSPRHRHALGVVALLLCLVVPLATAFHLSRSPTAEAASLRSSDRVDLAQHELGAELAATPDAETPFESLETEPAPSDTSTDARPAEVGSPASDLGFHLVVSEPLARRLRATSPWLALAWLAGATLLSLRPVLGRVALRRLLRALDGEAPEALRRRVAELAARLGIHRTVRVFVRARAQVPMLIGFLRPVVLLPMSACTGLSPAELDTLLLHELAHLRRLDPLVRVLQTAAETLLYYHPATWWISKVVRDEREKCCDDLVVATSNDRVSYLRALLRLEETRLGVPAGALAATDGSLLDRVQRIARLDGRPQTGPVSWTLAPLLAGALLLLGSPWTVRASTPKVQDDTGKLVSADPLLALERARALDEDTFRAQAAMLLAEHRGAWMVIVGGEVLGPFPEFEDAVAQSDRSHPDALHRFVFRPGIDDQDVSFQLSPWTGDSSHWFQLGRSFHQRAELTISAFEWMRGDLRVGTPNGRGRIEVSPPGESTSIAMHCVVSQMLESDQTIGEEFVQELGLERFAVPGFATGFGARPFRKVRAMVHVPGLHLDLPTVAIVIPLEYTARGRTLDRDHEATGEVVVLTGDHESAEEPPALLHGHRIGADDEAFVVYGRVTRPDGTPLANAEVVVHTGFGTLRRRGRVVTDELGVYQLAFGGGAKSPEEARHSTMLALFSAAREGFRHTNEQSAQRYLEHGTGSIDFAALSPHPMLTRGVPTRVDLVLEEIPKDEVVEIDDGGGN